MRRVPSTPQADETQASLFTRGKPRHVGLGWRPRDGTLSSLRWPRQASGAPGRRYNRYAEHRMRDEPARKGSKYCEASRQNADSLMGSQLYQLQQAGRASRRRSSRWGESGPLLGRRAQEGLGLS